MPRRGSLVVRHPARSVALIDAERDDEEVMRAEDEAIAAAEREKPEKVTPTGSTLAELIAREMRG